MQLKLSCYCCGSKDFEPKCQKETLKDQVIFMQGYLKILRLRAEIEGIEL